jgi:hypothetical protein
MPLDIEKGRHREEVLRRQAFRLDSWRMYAFVSAEYKELRGFVCPVGMGQLRDTLMPRRSEYADRAGVGILQSWGAVGAYCSNVGGPSNRALVPRGTAGRDGGRRIPRYIGSHR